MEIMSNVKLKVENKQFPTENTRLKKKYKQTEVGVIPADWKVESVGEAFEICNYLRFPISEDLRKKIVGEYPYYGPTKVQGYINVYRIEGEYALIGEDGDHFLKWRSLPMTLLVNGKFNVNNHAHLVKGTKNLTRYFFHYFSHRDLIPYLTRQGAGRYKLTKNALSKILCPIPSLPEQHAITEVLSDVDALLCKLNDLIIKKINIKQGTMQQLLTGIKRLPGFIDAWETKKIKELGEIITGGTPLTKTKEFWNGDVPWITPTDITDKKDIFFSERQITDIGLSTIRKLPQNTVLVTCIASIGKNSILRVNGACNQQINAVVPNTLHDANFIYYLMENNKPYLLANAGTTATSIISKKDFSELSFKLPAISEQKAIAQFLSDMDIEIERLSQKRDKAKLIRQGMMQELLTGKTRLV